MSRPQSAAPMHALEEHRAALAGRTLAELFAADADRFSRLSLSWDQWLADWSKQRVTPQAMDALVAFAHERNLQVIAPRVEDARGAAALWSAGVDFIQGNFVQRAGRDLAYDFHASVM